MEDVIRHVRTTVTDEINERLCRPYTEQETSAALKHMHPNKTPGPDGLNAFFYQKFWHIVDKDVSAAVFDILSGGAMPLMLNHTNVVLIPKKKNPTEVADYRPISLCNVLYKLITKVSQTG